jgi:curved DNA-binding protein CbpA
MATDMNRHALYQELGAQPDASDATIRECYRRRAKQTHPDVGGNAEEFAKVTQAYQILIDPVKREQYDRTGTMDNQVNNDRALILEHLARMLDGYMAQVANGLADFHVDIVEAMRGQVRDQIADISQAVAKMQTTAERLEKFAERFSAKKGKAILRMAAEAKAAAIRAAIPMRTKEVDKLEQVLELLDDQEFKFDPRPPAVHHGFIPLSLHPFDQFVQSTT